MKRTSIVFLLFFCGHLYSTDIAICNKGPLRIRNEPNTNSQVIGDLAIYEKVLITTIGKQDKIDNKTSNWYKIVTNKGIEGWVFGGYLSKYLLENGLDGKKVIFSQNIYPHDIRFVIENIYNELQINSYFVNKVANDDLLLDLFGSCGGMLLSENHAYSITNTEYSNYIVLIFCHKDIVIDLKVIQKSNSEAYVTTGPVVIDDGITDFEIFVVINGPYTKGYNSNIQGAYKANIKEKRIIKVSFKEIKIFAEDI